MDHSCFVLCEVSLGHPNGMRWDSWHRIRVGEQVQGLTRNLRTPEPQEVERPGKYETLAWRGTCGIHCEIGGLSSGGSPTSSGSDSERRRPPPHRAFETAVRALQTRSGDGPTGHAHRKRHCLGTRCDEPAAVRKVRSEVVNSPLNRSPRGRR